MKRICFDVTPLASDSRFRGIGMYAFELAQAMANAPAAVRDGLDVRFLMGQGRATRVVAAEPIAFERIDGRLADTELAYELSKKLFGRLRLMRAGVDLFHSSEALGTPHVGVGRTVVTCHDIIPTILAGPYLGRKPQWMSRLQDRIRYSRPDHVIAISEATREDVCRTLGLDETRVTVVHHGVDHSFFTSRPEPDERAALTSTLGTDRPYFVYVGAFDSRKRVPTLVEAFARIARELDHDLVIAGKLEPRRTVIALRAQIEQLGVRRRVHLVGFFPRALLPALYRHAAAHVLPSVYEGFGMTLLEAMASGCPVIACRASAMPEICGEAALMVEPSDVASLADAMRRIATDGALHDRVRRAGLERAKAFTWERAAAATFDVYRSLL